MDAAQSIVANQLGSPHQSVLHCRNPDRFTSVDSDNLQFVHNGKDHWLLVRSTNGQVQIFDSSRRKLNAVIRRSIQCTYALFKNRDGCITANLMNVQRQTDSFNCGVFAVAYAADIIFGINPVNSIYDVKLLRAHLIKCLESASLSPFPKVSSIGERKRKLVDSHYDIIII